MCSNISTKIKKKKKKRKDCKLVNVDVNNTELKNYIGFQKNEENAFSTLVIAKRYTQYIFVSHSECKHFLTIKLQAPLSAGLPFKNYIYLRSAQEKHNTA